MGDHPVPAPSDAHDADLVQATHALRDREESERLRQLGGLLVHDLNNVLFALLGRVQLLERRAGDPATAKAASEILETARLLERQVVSLHAACRRDEPAGEHDHAPRTGARAAMERALREATVVLPAAIRPGADALGAAIAAVPADASFEGDAAQVAAAVRQVVALHRARGGARALSLSVSTDALTGDAPRIALTIADHAGAPAAAPVMPRLGNDALDLAALPIAAAHRAIRDFGGRVECAVADDGLRSTISFDVRRGVSVARFDAHGAPTVAGGVSTPHPRAHHHDPAHDQAHDNDCDHACIPPARRVLIADDDPAVRAVLIAALEAVGDDVDALADPAACDAYPGLADFDVVILDAGGGGLEALTRLRARGVDVPVLVASGDLVERLGDARTRCVLKPIPLDALDRDLASLARLRTRE